MLRLAVAVALVSPVLCGGYSDFSPVGGTATTKKGRKIIINLRLPVSGVSASATTTSAPSVAHSEPLTLILIPLSMLGVANLTSPAEVAGTRPPTTTTTTTTTTTAAPVKLVPRFLNVPIYTLQISGPLLSAVPGPSPGVPATTPAPTTTTKAASIPPLALNLGALDLSKAVLSSVPIAILSPAEKRRERRRRRLLAIRRRRLAYLRRLLKARRLHKD